MSTRPVSTDARRRSPAPLLRRIAAATIAGILLAILGPFGSYLNPGPIARAGYWIGAMLIGLVLYGAALTAADAVAPPGTPARWPVLIGATLIASIPEAAVSRAGAFRLWPELAGLGLSWPVWFAQTATIGLIATLGGLFARHRLPVPVQDPTAPIPATPGLAARLPGDVLALQMEDHYVRVHTPRGSELVLMPLGRAMGAVDVEGLRTHRSWWVARHAVVSIEGTSRGMRLHLSNGVIAPVARSAVVHLKAGGWIAG